MATLSDTDCFFFIFISKDNITLPPDNMISIHLLQIKRKVGREGEGRPAVNGVSV